LCAARKAQLSPWLVLQVLCIMQRVFCYRSSMPVWMQHVPGLTNRK
jgi:hypothetical protein